MNQMITWSVIHIYIYYIYIHYNNGHKRSGTRHLPGKCKDMRYAECFSGPNVSICPSLLVCPTSLQYVGKKHSLCTSSQVQKNRSATEVTKDTEYKSLIHACCAPNLRANLNSSRSRPCSTMNALLYHISETHPTSSHALCQTTSTMVNP
jgi:hypothetical protein